MLAKNSEITLERLLKLRWGIMSIRIKKYFLGSILSLIIVSPALTSANSNPNRNLASDLNLPVVTTINATYEDMWSWVIADPESLKTSIEVKSIKGPDHSGVEKDKSHAIRTTQIEVYENPIIPKGIANPILAIAKCSHNPADIKNLVIRKKLESTVEGTDKLRDVLFSVLTSDRFEVLDSQNKVKIVSEQDEDEDIKSAKDINEEKIKRMCSELVLAKNVKDPTKLTEEIYVDLINSVLNRINIRPASPEETSYALESNELAKQFNVSSLSYSNSSYSVVTLPLTRAQRQKISDVLQDDEHKSCYLPKAVKKTGAKWARREHWAHIVTEEEEPFRLYLCKSLDPLKDELRKYTPMREFLNTAGTLAIDGAANIAYGQGYGFIGALLSATTPFFLPCGDFNDKLEAGVKRAVAAQLVNGLPNGGGLGKYSFLAGGRSDLGYANSVWGAIIGSATIGCATGVLSDAIQGKGNLASNCLVGAGSFVAGYMIFPNIADEKFLIYGISANKFSDFFSDGVLGAHMARTAYQSCKAKVVKQVSILTANDIRTDSLFDVLNPSRTPSSVEPVKKIKSKKKK